MCEIGPHRVVSNLTLFDKTLLHLDICGTCRSPDIRNTILAWVAANKIRYAPACRVSELDNRKEDKK